MCTNPKPGCCGNWTDQGECRGYCAVPERCGECEQCDPRRAEDPPPDAQLARLPGGAH